MFLPGRLAAKLALPCGPGGDSVQPAGVDLRIEAVEELGEPGSLGIRERRLPRGELVEPVNGWWLLGPGAYRIRFMDEVIIPEWGVGFCFPRSSLLRMGAALHCAVWDPGYRGRGQALLAVYNPHGVRIQVGARIAQLVIARIEPPPGEAYSGAYQGEATLGSCK